MAAPSVNVKTPVLPAAAVPASVAVPSPLSVKLMPTGSAPISLIVGTGKPVVVMLNDADEPAVMVSLAALVMAGASSTSSVNG